MDMETIQEYLHLWPRVSGIELLQDTHDSIRWAWEPTGCYSVSSAYGSKFVRREVATYTDFVSKQRAPQQCQFFSWLAMRNRCWTSDRLARRGLPHQDSCPLRNQHDESIDHLIELCVRQANLIWDSFGEPDKAPAIDDTLVEWCNTRTCATCPLRDLRTIITLTLWAFWKHRNAVVFDGVTPLARKAISNVAKEGRTWSSADLLRQDRSHKCQSKLNNLVLSLIQSHTYIEGL